MKIGRLCFAAVLAAIFFICIMITTLPGFAEEGVFVQSYRADIYLNGTLQEDYVYRIEEANRYRMLYRPWRLPISAQKLDYPYVEPLAVDPPQGSIPYAKDGSGKVTLLSSAGSDFEEDIQSIQYQLSFQGSSTVGVRCNALPLEPEVGRRSLSLPASRHLHTRS